MSRLKNPQDALVHQALQGQAHSLVLHYQEGTPAESFFDLCGIKYTSYTRQLFDQARAALGVPRRKRVGKLNPSWNGAKPRYRKGYRYVAVPGTFDKRGRTCWRPEHRLVMEETLGRPLTDEEVVHHRDDNPLNNDPKNLQLFPSNGAHLAETLKGKCPQWSEAGRQAILRSVRSKRGKRVAHGASQRT